LLKNSIKNIDTIIVTAQEWGYNYVLLEKNMWYISRIDEKKIKYFKYIAFYRIAPIYAITSYSKIKKIFYNTEYRRYDIILKGKLITIKPIVLDKDKRYLAPQSIKYTSLSILLKAKKISHLTKNK